MASEPFNISKIDQSPLDTKETDNGLSRSSSTTTPGSSSLPSVGPCINDNSIPLIRDKDADQETIATTDTHLPTEAQINIDHDDTASNHNDEEQEQLGEDDQQNSLSEEEPTATDEPSAPATPLEQQDPVPAVVATEHDERPQQPGVLLMPIHTTPDEGGAIAATVEEDNITNEARDHDLQQQLLLLGDEKENGDESNQYQQENPAHGSSGLDSDASDSLDGNEEHKQGATLRDIDASSATAALADKDTAPEHDEPAAASGAMDDDAPNNDRTNLVPELLSSSPSQGPNYSTNIPNVNRASDTDRASEHHQEREGHELSLPRLHVSEPDPMAAHLLEQYGDGSNHHSQQHLHHEDHFRDDGSEHTVMDTRRVWEADRHAAECRRCNRRFNFLVRRHHCRRCGLVVCDRCSGHRIRLPPDEIIQDPAIDPAHYPLIAIHPQRVCDVCVRLPIKEVSSSSSTVHRRATAPVSMKRSGSSQSLMSECPVCGHDLLGMSKKDQEKHLQLCLNAGSPSTRPPRYLVYELSPTSPQINYECPICFEEFKAGEKIARMICLCSYHRRCLSDWLERGKGCPVHYDPTL